MLVNEEIDKYPHERCHSIVCAKKAGLKVPFSIVLERTELLNPPMAELEKSYSQRLFVIHTLSHSKRGALPALTIKEFDAEKIRAFLKEVYLSGVDAALFTSSRIKGEADSKHLFFFALAKQGDSFFVEGTTKLSPTLYREGNIEFSFLLNDKSEKKAPEEIVSVIKKHESQLHKFFELFGTSAVVELGLFDGVLKFFEAKKETISLKAHKKIDKTTPIVLPKEHIIGIIGSKEGSEIIFLPKMDVVFTTTITKSKAVIFKQGSLLCHLAIVLREKNIPSVIFSDGEKLIGKKAKLMLDGEIEEE